MLADLSEKYNTAISSTLSECCHYIKSFWRSRSSSNLSTSLWLTSLACWCVAMMEMTIFKIPMPILGTLH